MVFKSNVILIVLLEESSYFSLFQDMICSNKYCLVTYNPRMTAMYQNIFLGPRKFLTKKLMFPRKRYVIVKN